MRHAVRLCAHHETSPRRCVIVGEYRLKLRVLRQTLRSGFLCQGELLALNGQTLSRARPFARRARMTARPPRVFMRTRKPWVRWRRVFEG